MGVSTGQTPHQYFCVYEYEPLLHVSLLCPPSMVVREDIMQCCDLSICLFFVPYPYLSNGAFLGYGYYRTLIWNRMLSRSHWSATRSGQNTNEAVTGASSEVFAMYLHHMTFGALNISSELSDW